MSVTAAKAIALVDVTRLYYANQMLNSGMRKFDYRVLRNILVPEGGEIHAWTTFQEGNSSQKKFIDLLEDLEYVVHPQDIRKMIAKRGRFNSAEIKDFVRFDAEIAFELGKLVGNGHTLIVATDSVPMAPLLKGLSDMGEDITHMWSHEILDLRWFNHFDPTKMYDIMEHRRELLGL